MLKQYLLLSGFVFSLLSASCRKKSVDVIPPVVVSSVTAPLSLKFANTVDGQPLVLSSMQYKNAHGDSFAVRTYKYYVSNVTLNTASSSYTVPNSYHMVRAGEDSTMNFMLSNVPAGNYVSVTFLIGVDKARNTSGAQTGDLDPIYGMLWDWRTGYIMAKMEGDFKARASSGIFEFHISGFNDDDNVLKWVTLPLPEAAIVAKGKTPVINIQSNVNEWFVNPTMVNLAVTNAVTVTGAAAMSMANNYADMFSVKSVVN